MKQFQRILGKLTQGVHRGFLLFIALVVVLVGSVQSGVLVAPTTIILLDKTRTGRMTVQNPSNSPKEISIRFSFGIPTSDSLGNISVPLKDSVDDPNSALGWITAFPRKVILPAGGSQVIRFRASPPEDLPDGEYWARVVVRSEEGYTTLAPPTDDGSITTKLNMIMQTAIALKYRKGDLTPALELNSARAESDSAKVSVLIDMSSKGNCSYIGILKCRLLDADNREVSQSVVQLAVYHDLIRRVNLPITGDSYKEPFQVDLYISTDGRTDIPAEEMLNGNEIKRTLIVR